MKKIILFTVFLSFFLTLNAQKKMYVWPAKVDKYVKTDILSGVSVNIEINDFRIIAPGSDVKATFQQLSDAIKESITKTYGKEFINPDSEIKVSINVQNYDVTFYTGVWHAQVKYLVKINDKEEEIEQTNNTFNVGGMPSAKKSLNKCFTGANLKLFEIFNDNLRKK